MKLFLPLLALGVVACAPKAVVTSAPPPVAGVTPAPTPPPPVTGASATAAINDVANTKIGSATLTDTPAGLLVVGSVTGLGLGNHGIHLHAVGICQAPGFASAGPHFNPTSHKHGFKNPDGHHAGDMPNLVSPPAGPYGFQFLIEGVRLTGRGGLLDDDGAAIVIHSGEDDYYTDPSGGSGGRFACGVITLSK